MKTCTKCKIEKALTEFYTDYKHKNGLRSRCKNCICTAAKVYRKTDAGKKAISKLNASEKRKRAQREYQATEEYKEYRRKYDASKKRKEARRKGERTTEKWFVSHSRSERKRKALKLNATIGPIDEAAIYEMCNHKCTYCGSQENLSLDHVVALAAGGAHCQDNLTVACQSCNSSKGAKPVAEWLAARG